MDWINTLTVGLLTSFVMSATIIASLWHNPRISLHSFPAVIQEAVPSKTDQERKLTGVYAIATVVSLLIAPCAYAFYSLGAGYLEIWVHLFVIGMIFNTVDLLILDWLIVCALTPRWIIIPGTERDPVFQGYKQYRFHWDGFVKGIGFCCAMPSIVVAATFVFRQFA